MTYNAVAARLMSAPLEQQRRNLFAAAAGRLDYGEVRQGMLGYAAWLSEALGIRPGDRVAICLPKSLETVTAIYGILCAGATYVPLQYQGPPARLYRILASLSPALLITTSDMAARIRATGNADLLAQRVIEIADGDGGLANFRRGVPPRRTPAEVSQTDLAAIFFTSGSTGEPKGVMWSQRGMAAAIASLPRWRRSTPNDRLISLSGLHYSASCEIFYPVMTESAAYVCDDHETMIADRMATILERDGTTIWSSTATALRTLVEGGNLDARSLGALRRVETFGERMPIAALRAAMAAVPGAEFCNLYAASEAFDMVEYDVPRPLPPDLDALPLGHPSPAYDLSLCDDAGRAVARGEIGEICVVGPAALAGYWSDPELSAAKRLPGVPESYRTGDLAIEGDDGLLRLVGRRDHVVKLRGHRFDLGEIEAAAKGAPGVREAVAVITGLPEAPGEVVLALLADLPAGERAALELEVRRVCLQRLPVFARPARLVTFAEFPLLSSGKIDRRELARRVLGL
jgi:amino acid adenylation domain-containing protein